MSYGIIKKISSVFGMEELEEEEIISGPVPVPVTRQQFKILVYEPKKFEDVKRMADAFLEKSVVLISFDQVDSALRRRIIDYMNGLAYASLAQVEKISENIIIYVPENVTFDRDVPRTTKTSKWF